MNKDSCAEASVFSNASYAPMRSLGHSITRGVVIFHGSLIKALAQQQSSFTLSSSEAELHAIQTMTQQSVLNIVDRIVSSFKWLSKAECPCMQLSKVSESAVCCL